MVHRIDRILPDIDNRLIPSNAGRSSKNLRFAASVSDTDLGTTLVNGLAEIEYAIPAGDNLVTGANDRSEEGVFFTLWNSNDDHGLYRILDGVIEKVLAVPDLTETADVDIRAIDGKVYWTDNVNQPRMCNIQKGIDGDYPDPLEEWMITQIKRPPGLYLETTVDKGSGYVSTEFTLADASIDYNNEFPNESGFQFAYYYVYDNDEESRLSPVTPVNWWTTLLKIRIPQDEFDAYLNDINLVKYVVFCFRIGNDGIWYEIKRIENIPGNYVNDGGGNPGLQYLIPNVTILPKTAVSSDITDADFDSVPLLAATLEVAQNRLDLGNYLIDYANWDGLTLELVAEPIVRASGDGSTWRVAKAGELYNGGIELLDEWGRKIAVVAATSIQIPEPTYTSYGRIQGVTYTGYTDITDFPADIDNQYGISYTISGTFPSWAKYYRVVFSKALTVTQFNPTVVRGFNWYTLNGVDYFASSDNWTNTTVGSDTYIYMGTALVLGSGEPFQFTSADTQFVNFIPQYYKTADPFPPDLTVNPVRYKIEKQVANMLFIKNLNIIPNIDIGFPGTATGILYYPIELIEIGDSSEILWQTTEIFDVGSGTLTGTWGGDTYISKFEKLNNGGSQIGIGGSVFDWNSLEMTGYFISENPTNIYSQIWSSDIGQSNVVNENQRQKRILQGIVFSNPLIQGTQINGLSKFNSIDNRQAPLENGPITALVRTSATQREPGVLLAIGTNGVSSFYYDGIQLTNVDGTANVSTSDKYLASQRPLVGNYGAQKLRNVCVTPLGTVYFWSENIKDWIRYTNAGLDQLGEIYGFMNYQRNQLSDSTEIMMTYDQVTDEAIMIGNASDALIFSERYKTFQGSREYLVDEIRPERGASIATRTFLFRQGHVWQMGPGVSVDDNSFFGELKDPTLTIVTNPEPMTVKRWNQIRMFGPLPSSTIMRSEPQEGTQDDTLVSHIDEGWWIQRKSNFDAAIRTAEDGDGEVLNGRIMESRLLITTFVWPAGSFVKLNYIEIKATRAPVQ